MPFIVFVDMLFDIEHHFRQIFEAFVVGIFSICFDFLVALFHFLIAGLHCYFYVVLLFCYKYFP